MRVNKRKVAVKLIEQESILNHRLVEYFAIKYREERLKNNG